MRDGPPGICRIRRDTWRAAVLAAETFAPLAEWGQLRLAFLEPCLERVPSASGTG